MLDYEFTKELENLINRHSVENGSNTPDFMLAEYLIRCIDNYNQLCRQRDSWYSVHLCPGNSHFEKQKDEERPQDIMEGELLRTTAPCEWKCSCGQVVVEDYCKCGAYRCDL